MAIGTAIAVGLGVGSAVAGVGSAVIGSKASSKAAEEQANAAKSAAQLQKESADQALAYQKEKDAQSRADLEPWRAAGAGALGQLSDLMKPGGALTQKFQAPTGADMQNQPGYQFRLREGQQALERSAAARGGLLSGGTAKALTQYGQDYASGEYGNVYNRAFNAFQTDQSNQYNRLAGLAGTGQTAATTLGAQGQNSASNVGSLLIGSGNQQADAINNSAAARASGYINSANAINSGISSGIGGVTNSYLLSRLFQPQAAAGTFNPYGFGTGRIDEGAY